MYTIHPSKDPRDLTKNEIESISKTFLLKYYSAYINYLWDSLPEKLQCDSEISSYRPCRDHFNPPWERVHVDASAPARRDCEKCHITEELLHVYTNQRSPTELTSGELQIIPPSIFKRHFSEFTDILWDRMPSHYYREIESYRRCYEHANTSSMEDHFDGPIPQRRNCRKCRENMQ